MSDTLGDRIRAQRDARRAAARSAAAPSDADDLMAQLRAYIDEKITALATKNGLTLP